MDLIILCTILRMYFRSFGDRQTPLTGSRETGAGGFWRSSGTSSPVVPTCKRFYVAQGVRFSAFLGQQT